MSNKSINTVKTAIGLAFLSSTLATPLSALAENPFVATDLGTGYQVASKDAEGKCGEGKCGADKAGKETEGKCGEGKCGESAANKDAEGKCGEGKCGAEKSTAE
ncbi:MAG: hypothetical protein AB7U63_08070 [Porticoccaceae bacterium]